MTRKLGRFISLPIGQKLFVSRVAIVLPLVAVTLRLFGVKVVLRCLRAWPRQVEFNSKLNANDVQELSQLVSMVTRNHPVAGKCLCKSLTLWWCLIRAGVGADLQIGVRMENGKFLSHAWVEFEGTPLAESITIGERFNVFTQSDFRDWIWS